VLELVGRLGHEQVDPAHHLVEVVRFPRARSSHSSASPNRPTASTVASSTPAGRRWASARGSGSEDFTPAASSIVLTGMSFPASPKPQHAAEEYLRTM
jgi:hypothetical protein